MYTQLDNPLKVEDMQRTSKTVAHFAEQRSKFLGLVVPSATETTICHRYMILKGCSRSFVQQWLLLVRAELDLDFAVHPTLAESLSVAYACIYEPQVPESRLCISMSA